MIYTYMESTLAKKITTNIFFLYFGIFLFALFFYFIQSCYLIFHNQKVSTHCKEQNKRKMMTIVKKIKILFKVKKCPKNAQKTQNFSFKNT